MWTVTNLLTRIPKKDGNKKGKLIKKKEKENRAHVAWFAL